MAKPVTTTTITETRSTAEGVRDTLESIVIALILAFIFRAFIVEAFVIPTGSMAPTLYGQQVTTICSTCGYEYALGVQFDQNGGPVEPSPQCPNCNMGRESIERRQITNPGSGDRILVHKWPLDVPLEAFRPQRWDVTVFKDPRDGKTNFIKRLVGLPGEVLQIIDGDIYAAPIAALAETEDWEGLRAKFDSLRKDVYRWRTEGRSPQSTRGEYTARCAEINQQIIEHLRIQTKPPRAQEALWRIVYDHDYLPNYDSLRPNQLEGNRVGWLPDRQTPEAQSAWDTSKRTITFKAQNSDPLFIRLNKEIRDYCAYNGTSNGYQEVGDIRLTFSWLPRSGDGGLVLQMNRHRDRFTARIDVDGSLEVVKEDILARGAEAQPQSIAAKKLGSFSRDRMTRIEFIIVDYQVRLTVDGETAVASSPSDYAPRPVDLLTFCHPRPSGTAGIEPSVVRIGARHLACELRHLRVDRDVYYRSQPNSQPKFTDPYDEGHEVYNPFFTWPGWATAGHPMMLRENRWGRDGKRYRGEYFMLGDNSAASKDSRLWWEVGPHLERLGNEYQVGTVPEDQLIGQAFFVYWPSGYRPSWAGNIGLVPNFGRMRWIR